MDISNTDIDNWFKDFEDQIMDRKSIGILSHPDDLASLMVAFANNKSTRQEFGGRIIIGIDNNGTMDNFTPKQGHEELIMDVARGKCLPALSPHFEKIGYNGGFLYVVTIPKMTDTPYQLKTKNGNIHKIRVGSTVRDPTYLELRGLYSLNNANQLNVDLLPDGLFVKLLLKLGRWYVMKIRRVSDVPLEKEVKVLRIIGCMLVAPVSIFTLWRALTHTFNLSYDVQLIFGLTFIMLGAAPCFSTIKLIKTRKCDKCKFNFAYEKIHSKLVDEKQFHTIDGRQKIMRIINDIFTCHFCNYEKETTIVDYVTRSS
jgi:hypothetical protein